MQIIGPPGQRAEPGNTTNTAVTPVEPHAPGSTNKRQHMGILSQSEAIAKISL